MMIKVLQSKIRYATVTDSNFKYHGSIGIDSDLMRELGIVENQVVNVNSMDGSVRTETYVIPEEAGSGKIFIRGALAALLYKGDQIHINVYCMMSPEAASIHKPIIIESNE